MTMGEATNNPYRTGGQVFPGQQPEHTVESLMKLIAELNGHGYESSIVNIGYMRARVFTAQDESHLDDTHWGFTASTTLFGEKDYNGQPQRVSGQGRELIDALKSLAREIVDAFTKVQQTARKKLLDAKL